MLLFNKAKCLIVDMVKVESLLLLKKNQLILTNNHTTNYTTIPHN